MKKLIAPAAVVALKEALTDIYWYKKDLRSFLTQTISHTGIITRLDWDGYKRNIVSTSVDIMARDQERFQEELLSLMTEVARMEDFSHLKQLEDGDLKAKKAEQAVAALRKFIKPHDDLIKEQKEAEERRKRAFEATLRVQGVHEKLKELSTEFCRLIGPEEPQQRGYRLEKILRELFRLMTS
jgi:hypothetical protein